MSRKRVLYPSVQQPIFTPAAVVVPTFFQADTRQHFRSKVAQQPNAYCAPVMVIPPTVVTGTSSAVIF